MIRSRDNRLAGQKISSRSPWERWWTEDDTIWPACFFPAPPQKILHLVAIDSLVELIPEHRPRTSCTLRLHPPASSRKSLQSARYHSSRIAWRGLDRDEAHSRTHRTQPIDRAGIGRDQLGPISDPGDDRRRPAPPAPGLSRPHRGFHDLCGEPSGLLTKTIEIAANPKVELCYLDEHHDQVRITGKAEVETDRTLLQEIWDANPLLRQYLGSIDNPELIVSPGPTPTRCGLHEGMGARLSRRPARLNSRPFQQVAHAQVE